MCVNLLINEQISNFNPDFVTKRVFSCKNLHSWKNFYTTAGRDSRNKFQVCLYFCSSYPSFDLIYFKVQVSRKQRTRWIRSVLKISQRSSRIFIFITTIHFCLPYASIQKIFSTQRHSVIRFCISSFSNDFPQHFI